MLFGWRKKYKKLESDYNELKKKYDELLGWYHKLYDKYISLKHDSGPKVRLERVNHCDVSDIGTFRDVLKKYIKHNVDNIHNHNEIDDKYPTRRYVCLDGQVVRSKVEREIYNYLILNGVKVRHEAVFKLPHGGHFRPDFYLPEYKLYIEYYGKSPGEDPKYDEDRKFKKHFYTSLHARVVEIENSDSYDIYNILKLKLSNYINTSNWI